MLLITTRIRYHAVSHDIMRDNARHDIAMPHIHPPPPASPLQGTMFLARLTMAPNTTNSPTWCPTSKSEISNTTFSVFDPKTNISATSLVYYKPRPRINTPPPPLRHAPLSLRLYRAALYETTS